MQADQHRCSCQDEATTTQTPELSQTCTGGGVTQTLSSGHTYGNTQTQTHAVQDEVSRDTQTGPLQNPTHPPHQLYLFRTNKHHTHCIFYLYLHSQNGDVTLPEPAQYKKPLSIRTARGKPEQEVSGTQHAGVVMFWAPT